MLPNVCGLKNQALLLGSAEELFAGWSSQTGSKEEFTLSQSGKDLDLAVSSEHGIKDKSRAQETGPGCLLFYISTSVLFSIEILTKQFTIFGMLMAVKLHQKRDLLLN